MHDPTDSSRVPDGVRVLTRPMPRASGALGDARGRVRHLLRSVGRRVLIIGRQARSAETRDALVRSYRRVMTTTRAGMRDAGTMVRRISQGLRTASAATGVDLDPRAPAAAADAAIRDAHPQADPCAPARRRYPRTR